jgi:hypothetical protein
VSLWYHDTGSDEKNRLGARLPYVRQRDWLMQSSKCSCPLHPEDVANYATFRQTLPKRSVILNILRVPTQKPEVAVPLQRHKPKDKRKYYVNNVGVIVFVSTHTSELGQFWLDSCYLNVSHKCESRAHFQTLFPCLNFPRVCYWFITMSVLFQKLQHCSNAVWSEEIGRL